MSFSATGSILVVDDDPAMLDIMSDRLRMAGHSVWPAGSAGEAGELLRERRPDLIVLDLILPDADGLVFCQALRDRVGSPIVVVSGTQRRRDAVLALKIGADDFLGKPFDLDEFEARVGAVLRRRGVARPLAEEAGRSPQGLDATRQAVRVGDEIVPLTPTEYRVFAALAARPGELVSHEEIARAVWGRNVAELGRAVDTQARRLRVKLARYPGAPRIVKEYGRGYALLPAEEPGQLRHG